MNTEQQSTTEWGVRAKQNLGKVIKKKRNGSVNTQFKKEMGRIVAVGSRSPLVGLSIISSLPFSSGREKRAYTHHKTFLSLSLFIAVSRFSFRQRCPDAHTNTQTSLSVATAVEEEIDGHEKNWDVRAVGRSTVQARESRAGGCGS